ncbi:hypothetical protein SGUI_0895 [Serinicoccus hydrothermalis]|uniref:Uncharacterized protein n=1 Tax=Serinicoccus hydrothermalis TaxID=1758689 RepID=A0A1B1NA60_9MICO|nr:hypothetical protein [Serinicoccus hydrothermalis]ANS78291.1 hypothetical protein SGUI_0895 [Serinicoccus hydrothermalis]
MTSPQRPPGTRVLWPLAALLTLAGLVLLTLSLTGPGDRSGADMVGARPGDLVSVGEEGMSVWSRSPDTRADTVCTLDDQALDRPTEDFTTRVAGEEFHEVARTGGSHPTGDQPLVCDTEDTVYAGPFGPATAPTGLRGGTGLTLGLLLLPLGLVCAVLAVLARRRTVEVEQGPDPGAYTLDPRTSPPPQDPYGPPPSGPPGQAGGPTGPRYDLPPPP